MKLYKFTIEKDHRKKYLRKITAVNLYEALMIIKVRERITENRIKNINIQSYASGAISGTLKTTKQ